MRALPYGNDFNETLLANGEGKDGKIYAVPAKSIYAVALHYNRKLFEQAGLDPNKPPTTWDEVRADAKTIHDKTGIAGYGMMALDASGGWQLAAGANSRGGVIEKADSSGKYTSTLNDPAIKAHLEWLKSLRWDDGSLLERADLGWGEINAAFAGGEVAMYTSGSDVYNALVESNGVTKDWGYGLTAIPTSSAGGALTGGTLAAVHQGLHRRREGRRRQVDRLVVPVEAAGQGPGRGRRQDPSRGRPGAGRGHPGAADLLRGPVQGEPGAGSRTTSTSRSMT